MRLTLALILALVLPASATAYTAPFSVKVLQGTRTAGDVSSLAALNDGNTLDITAKQGRKGKYVATFEADFGVRNTSPVQVFMGGHREPSAILRCRVNGSHYVYKSYSGRLPYQSFVSHTPGASFVLTTKCYALSPFSLKVDWAVTDP